MKNAINKKFYHNTDGIEVNNVGDLIDLLSELPRGLKTSGWSTESMLVTVCNVSEHNPHLRIDMD